MVRSRTSSVRGFTIIEMMVVMVIMALAMTVVPAIVSGLDGSRLRAASDDLIAHLREARNQALRTQTPVDVFFDLRQHSFMTTYQPGTQYLPAVVDRVALAPAALADPNGIARLRFQSDGSATPARISLWRRSGSTDITVDWLTGRIGTGG
jgi:general secretion pathway protein H